MSAVNETAYQILVQKSLDTLNATKIASVGLILSGLLASVTNPLVMWTIWSQKSLHTGCFCLIAQLSFADWIVGVSYVATGFKRLIRLWFSIPEVNSQVICCLEMAPPYFGQSASLTVALVIGIERLIAVAFPMQFYTRSWSIANLLASIAWIWSMTETAFMFYGISSSKYIPNCNLVSSVTDAFYNFQNVESGALVIVITVVYALVVIEITLQLRTARKTNQTDQVVQMKKNLQVKTAQMLVVVASMYLILQAATRIGLALLASVSAEDRANYAPFIRMLMIINSGINFFIYFSMSTEFKTSFKKSLGWKVTLIASGQVTRQPPLRDIQRVERTFGGGLQTRNNNVRVQRFV
uniref:G-protein coupled receptors family 1 profile domain-containing protein n=1 Tax=Plectus sambesii TaxID=2011161 RepID=A0A914XMT0_9BILA